MNLVALGTIALDSIETPFGKKDEILGGSTVYFSLAARFFSECGIVGVVGEDFPGEHLSFLNEKGVDTLGVEKAAGKTFRWSGSYEYDMNSAHTLDTQLNVLASFKPKIPAEYENAKYLFLANTDPDIQLDVLDKVKPEVSICDTMNFWIENKRDKVSEVFEACDMIVINEGEARMYCDTPNLIKAGRELLKTHTDRVVIKKGEHGSLYFSKNSFFTAPAYPTEDVVDPTGAGDSFAGGTVGHLAKHGVFNDKAVKKSLVCGSIIASFMVSGFSVDGIKNITHEDIDRRYEEFKKIVAFDHII
ncbi:MAG: PfkB family carbohydrate kinase [Candidatus Altiarchaeota archaeon]